MTYGQNPEIWVTRLYFVYMECKKKHTFNNVWDFVIAPSGIRG